jgi:hypothetical protein
MAHPRNPVAWKNVEELALTKAWLDVSDVRAVRDERKYPGLLVLGYDSLSPIFGCKHYPRNMDMLTGKWKEFKHKMREFERIYKESANLLVDEDMRLEEAKRRWSASHSGVVFKSVDSWTLARTHEGTRLF